METFLLGGFVVFALLALHPFLTYPASLGLLRLFRRKPVVSDLPPDPPSLSICFCAYNEESVIRDKIHNLEAVATAYPGSVEIFLYTDGCSDRTYEIAVEAAETVKVIRGEGRQGKASGMNRLAGEASGSLIVFTDANVMLAEDALSRIAAAFGDEDVGCAGGTLVYVNPEDGHVASVGSLYWRLEETIKTLETATGSMMGCDGAFFAIRHGLFRRVPPDMIDDMFTSLGILCDGHRLVSVSDAIAYEKVATRSGDEFRRKIRIACRSFNCHRRLQSRLIRMSPLNIYKYVSHKLVRWLTVFTAAAAGVFFLAFVGVRFGAPAAVGTVTGVTGLLTAGLLGFPALRSVTEMLLSFIAVGVGVLRSLQGQRYQTWTPPQSAR